MCTRLLHLVPVALVLALLLFNTTSAKLVGHWAFDEGSGTIAQDGSGKGHDGTLLGDPQWVPGMVGSGALSFDGSDGLVEAGHDASLSLTDALTVTAWISVNDLNTYYFIFHNLPIFQMNLSMQILNNFIIMSRKNEGCFKVCIQFFHCLQNMM